jgi:hypothetical protein
MSGDVALTFEFAKWIFRVETSETLSILTREEKKNE